MITRKDADLLAEGIGKELYGFNWTREQVTNIVAHAARMSNPRFNPDKFRQAVEDYALKASNARKS